MRFRFSKREVIDLTKAWVALSIAFGVVLTVRENGISFFSSDSFIFRLISTSTISAITVGIGFLLHESAHKYVAQKYGHFAEFYSSDQMLLLALLMSPLGFIIALPGAVMISGMITRTQNGKISIAGPLINFVLAIIFAVIAFSFDNVIVRVISQYGFMINTWLGLFNLIPVWEFDGKKILAWSKRNYFLMVILGVFLFFAGGYLP